jgi:hypothetical protein
MHIRPHVAQSMQLVANRSLRTDTNEPSARWGDYRHQPSYLGPAREPASRLPMPAGEHLQRKADAAITRARS